ncbi:septal ring lytic transglycosylase RlpA family protein [Candidatus Sororendozoicomonas aggregata]|uniref:septal ring lytic transglycosylase RlpA family protein n=1 Tax=Candidatus Sororendozoicomonas aggregata TaxID=3073239 RepID=UPI002ED16321
MENSSSLFRYCVFAVLATLLSGCSTNDTVDTVQDSAPSGAVDVSLIPDAVPEVHNGRFKYTPYTLNGIQYTPMASANGYTAEGTASWYGTKFHGKQTANGEVYDMYKMTAAHKTLPLPSYVKVTNLENGRSVVLRVNDRGPFYDDRLIDVSYVAAKKLGFANDGTADVKIEGIDPVAFAASKPHKETDPLVFLQLAALKNFHNAQKLRRTVAEKLMLGDDSIRISKDDKQQYHRVRIGPLESPQQMEELLEQLAEADFGTPFVVYE